MRIVRLLFVVFSIVVASPSLAEPQPHGRDKTKVEAAVLTTAAIIALLIAASRQSYYAMNKPCACPEDADRAGRRCGARSAYSRPRGHRPLCYPTDVSADLIEEYRKSKRTLSP